MATNESISKPKSDSYNADQIKVLEGLDAVRKRPAMYIGSTGVDGLHHLVYEVVDNSVDEHMAGFGETIEVTIHIDGSVTVVDNGRGIPTGMHSTQKKSAAEVALTVLHAGGKFEQGAYTVSGGLHGVGISVVNALSEWLELEIWQDGQVFVQRYQRGKPEAPLQVTGKTKRRGTKVTFKPDGQIFETLEFSFDVLAQRLRELAFLNKGVRIVLTDERLSTPRTAEFKFDGGLKQFVEHLNKNKTVLHKEPIYFTGTRDDVERVMRLFLPGISAAQWQELVVHGLLGPHDASDPYVTTPRRAWISWRLPARFTIAPVTVPSLTTSSTTGLSSHRSMPRSSADRARAAIRALPLVRRVPRACPSRSTP